MSIQLNNISSGYSTGLINDNFTTIEEYINSKLLNRADVELGEPNQMEVNLDMNGFAVLNAGTDPSNPGSLLTRSQADSLYVNLTGDSMQGSLNMDTYPITVRVAVNGNEPARKDELDTERSQRVSSDSAITQALNSEVVNRIAGDNSVTQAFQSADANLQSQISGGAPLEASAFSPISWHSKSINNSVVIPDDVNAWSFGPALSISQGQSVTVGVGSSWTIANGSVPTGSELTNYDEGEL